MRDRDDGIDHGLRDAERLAGSKPARILLLPSLGTWNRWAITWRCSQILGNKNPEKEAEALSRAAGEVYLKEHEYGTDEDTYPVGATDPLFAIFDSSSDPLAWAKERIGVCQDILGSGKLEERVVGEGENYVPPCYGLETLLVQE